MGQRTFISTKDLKIRLADLSEIEIALSLLKDAAIWLKDKGIDYWQNWISPVDFYLDWIKEGFDLHQFYFVLNDSGVIGMFRMQWSDEKFWGIQDKTAGYIHSFTIEKNYHGQDLGREILSMIEDVCKSNNKWYLRLDCGVDIERLCKYYEDNGFNPKGEVSIDIYRLRLYEKELFDD